MKPAVDVVYRDFDSSAALNDIITKKLEKLSRYTDQIVHSRVVLDTPHHHKHKGKQYRASIELDIKRIIPTAINFNVFILCFFN